MIKLLLRCVFISATVTLLIGCSEVDKEKSNGSIPQMDTLATAKMILDSINSLDANDLIKINTKGCVGNCLPFATFARLSKYEHNLSSMGYFTKWENDTHRYSLMK